MANTHDDAHKGMVTLICPIDNGGCGKTNEWAIKIDGNSLVFDCQCGYRTKYIPQLTFEDFQGPSTWDTPSGVKHSSGNRREYGNKRWGQPKHG